MKRIYAIADMRDDEPTWITDPIILENDVQASMAYTDYQRNLLKNHIAIKDLRLYRIAFFDSESIEKPIIEEVKPKEIAINLVDESTDKE